MTPVFGIVLLICVVIITIIVIYATCGYESDDSKSDFAAIKQIKHYGKNPPHEYYIPRETKYRESINTETWHDGVSQASPHTGLPSINYGETDMADSLLYTLGQRLKSHDHITDISITPQWPSGGHWVDIPLEEYINSNMLKEGINDYTENDLLLELRASVNKWLEPVKL
jgi:hypothetical protein